MKKFLTLVVLVTTFGVKAQQQITIGENWEDEEAYNMLLNADGTIMMVGFSEAIDSGTRDAYMIKLDANGDTLWTKKFHSRNLEEFRDIIKTTDGGYIMTGTTWDDGGSDNEDVFVVKTDANGNLDWMNSYGGDNHQRGLLFLKQMMVVISL